MDDDGDSGTAPLRSVPYYTRLQSRPRYGLQMGHTSARVENLNDTNDAGDNGQSLKPSLPFARIATLNIQAGHGAAAWNLQAVAEDADLMKLDIIFVQETKIRNEKHASSAGHFDIIASETSRNNKGGVAIFIRRVAGDDMGWTCEDAKVYDTNVVAVTFVSGRFRRRLVGVYLSPSEIDGDTWNGLSLACQEAKDPIWIIGDLNVNLHSTQTSRLDLALNENSSTRCAEVKAFVASWGCENFGHTKLQRKRTGVWSWRHRRTIDGSKMTIKSVCDFICGPRTDPVRSYRTRSTTNVRTDHRMVYVDLLIRPKEHQRYMRGRKKFPFLRGPDLDVDLEYFELLKLQEAQQRDLRKAKPSWISEEAWNAIRLRNNVVREHLDPNNNRRKRQLKRHIRRLLKRDRLKKMDDDAKLIEETMGNNCTKEGFQILQKWYKRRAGVRLPMSRRVLTNVATEWSNLYSEKVLAKPMFPLDASMDLNFVIPDDPLTVQEIRTAAKRMKRNKAPGTSQFRADTIIGWARADPSTTEADCFNRLASLCQKIFQTGRVPKRMKEGILVLLPKNGMKNEFRGITLLDCVYKLISVCMNERAKEVIKWHEGIHGFRLQRGCQTALFEAKKDMSTREEAGRTYHQIFLDLSKAFDTVDRRRLLTIMSCYGFGFRAMRFFTNCWEGAFVAPRAGGVYGPRVTVRAGVRQGDVISPLLFNLMVDAILRYTDREKPDLLARVQTIFYADDGRLGGEEADKVQEVMDFVADLFERMGLEVNTSKTVSMTNRLRFRQMNIAFSAKARAQLHEPAYRERWQAFTECEICGKILQRRSLRRHCLHCHPEIPTVHDHPGLWSPEPGRQQHEGFTVYWDRDEETGTNLCLSCPHDTCMSTRFKSPAMLYRHWSVAGHGESLKVMDRRGDTPIDVSFRHQCPKCLLWMRNPVPPLHAETKACRDNTARRMAKIQQSRHNLEMQRSPFKSKGGAHLKRVNNFLYLGRTLEAANDDTLAVQRGISKAKKKWAEIRRVLSRVPIRAKTFVRFYKAIILNVLLYGSETWRVSKQCLDSLEAFHNKCVRTMSGQPFKRTVVDGEAQWIRPSISPLLTKLNLKTPEEYIAVRKSRLEASYGRGNLIERGLVSLKSYVLKRKLFL
jgi:exonuclease III